MLSNLLLAPRHPPSWWLNNCKLLSSFFQETSRESRVGRHAKETGMTSGWGSAWPARTVPTVKYWWVRGPDYTNIIVTDLLPWTVLFNHSWPQHFNPPLVLCACKLWIAQVKTEFKRFTFFFCLTTKVRQIWKLMCSYIIPWNIYLVFGAGWASGTGFVKSRLLFIKLERGI